MISVKNKKEELQDKWLQKSKIKITNEVINKNESKINVSKDMVYVENENISKEEKK